MTAAFDNEFQVFVTGLAASQSVDDLHKIFCNYLARKGFDQYGYQVVANKIMPQLEQFHTTNFSNEWVNYYFQNKYYEIDPTLGGFEKNILPFVWGPEAMAPEMGAQQKKMFCEAGDFHVDRGIGIPLFSPMQGFSVVTLCASDIKERELQRYNNDVKQELLTVSLYYHHAVMELKKAQLYNKPKLLANDNIELSVKESDCLKWLVEGKSYWEAARILGISERALKHRVSSLFRKTQSHSRQELVIKAIQSRLVS